MKTTAPEKRGLSNFQTHYIALKIVLISVCFIVLSAAINLTAAVFVIHLLAGAYV